MTEDLRNEIVRRWRSGTPQRMIARTLQVSRGAVRRALCRHEQARGGVPPQPLRRVGLLAPYQTVMLELLQRYPELTATGQVLAVRITSDELRVYSPQLEEVARHRLLARNLSGQRCLDPAHHPAASDGRQRLKVLQERYQELGPVAVQFLEGLLRTQRYNRDQAQRVLGLLGAYARADLLAALERAVRFGAYTASAVERILAAQARPRGPWTHLTDQTRAPEPGAVGPRPTAEYQPLLPPLEDADHETA